MGVEEVRGVALRQGHTAATGVGLGQGRKGTAAVTGVGLRQGRVGGWVGGWVGQGEASGQRLVLSEGEHRGCWLPHGSKPNITRSTKPYPLIIPPAL